MEGAWSLEPLRKEAGLNFKALESKEIFPSSSVRISLSTLLITSKMLSVSLVLNNELGLLLLSKSKLRGVVEWLFSGDNGTGRTLESLKSVVLLIVDAVVSLEFLICKSSGSARYISELSQALETTSLKTHILCSSVSKIQGIVIFEPSSWQK